MSPRIKAFTSGLRTFMRYPWDEWLDGSIWHLERGQDFLVDRQNMRSMIYTNAAKRGLSVTVHYVGKDALELQARA